MTDTNATPDDPARLRAMIADALPHVPPGELHDRMAAAVPVDRFLQMAREVAALENEATGFLGIAGDFRAGNDDRFLTTATAYLRDQFAAVEAEVERLRTCLGAIEHGATSTLPTGAADALRTIAKAAKAALGNWHAALTDASTAMRPGIAPPHFDMTKCDGDNQ